MSIYTLKNIQGNFFQISRTEKHQILNLVNKVLNKYVKKININ